MSCDSVHACIGNKIKHSGDLYDYDDFANVIKSSRKRLATIELSEEDFWAFDLSDAVSRVTGISEARAVQVRRGSMSIYLKNDFENDFHESLIFKRESLRQITSCDGNYLDLVSRENTKRGISREKYSDLTKLAKTMPVNRRQFYENLRVSDIEDLAERRCIDF